MNFEGLKYPLPPKKNRNPNQMRLSVDTKKLIFLIVKEAKMNKEKSRRKIEKS